MSYNVKEKSRALFGWLVEKSSNLKINLLRILFPNEWGGTSYYRYKHDLLMRWDELVNWFINAKVFFKPLRIPTAIEDLESAADFSIKAIEDLEETIRDKNNVIEGLIEKFVEERYHNLSKPEGVSDDDHFRNCYRQFYLDHTDCDTDNKNVLAYADVGGIKLPSKYLTKSEDSYRFDMDYEYYRESLCGCHETYYSEATFILRDLQERGFYKGGQL